MSTTELKYQLHQLIEKITDSSVLQAIHTLLKNQVEKDTDWWDELTDQQKASIEKGLDDIRNGRTTPHNKAMSELDEHIRKYG